MRRNSAFYNLLIIAIGIFLTPVCSQAVVARAADPTDEVVLLAGVSKDSLAAIDAGAKQTETELAAIHARLKTQLADLALSIAKATELLNSLKDTRQDLRAERMQKAQALLAAEAKIRVDNEAIDLQMKEAREKAEAAMQQAQTGLVIGMLSAAIQTSSAADTFNQGDAAGLTSLLQKQLFNVNFQVLEIRMDPGITVRIRVGQAISCLSSKNQCSGLSFTNTK